MRFRRKSSGLVGLLMLLAAWATPVWPQQETDWPGPRISLEDLQAAIERRSEQLASYRALLSDPDPNRSLTAFQILSSSDDPVLKRLALEHGLFSSNNVIRNVAIASLVSSRTMLELNVGSLDRLAPNVAEEIVDKWGETINISMKSPGSGAVCLILPDVPENCSTENRVSLREETLEIQVGGLSGQLRWSTDQGKFIGILIDQASSNFFPVSLSLL